MRANSIQRMINRAQSRCIDGQKEDLNNYIAEVREWANRENNWRDLQQNGFDANNAAALQAEIDAFETKGLRPQLQGIREGHINLNSLQTADKDENGMDRPDQFDKLRIILGVWNFDVLVVGRNPE